MNTNNKRVIIRHQFYPCDSGCDGHEICLYDGDILIEKEFEFDRPGDGEDARVWATSWANNKYPGVPLDWAACRIVDG